MYGEEYVHNSINSVSNARDEVQNVGNSSVALENKSNNLREIESDQKSKGNNRQVLKYLMVSHVVFF